MRFKVNVDTITQKSQIVTIQMCILYIILYWEKALKSHVKYIENVKSLFVWARVKWSLCSNEYVSLFDSLLFNFANLVDSLYCACMDPSSYLKRLKGYPG